VPTRSKQPCAYPRCPTLVERGFCASHTHLETADRIIRDHRRGSAHSRGYTREWNRERLRFLADHPVCECELHQGRDDAPAATRRRSRQAAPRRPVLFWDRSNWQALASPATIGRPRRKTDAGDDARWRPHETPVDCARSRLFRCVPETRGQRPKPRSIEAAARAACIQLRAVRDMRHARVRCQGQTVLHVSLRSPTWEAAARALHPRWTSRGASDPAACTLAA
jgi:5-methylcytosine-specific restriction protein A